MTKWPMVRLVKLATPIERPEVPTPGIEYRQVGVKLWGQGAYQRESIDGGATKYTTFSRVKANDIIVNKIWARNGSVAVVQKSLEDSYVSGEFPTFTPVLQKLEPRWFHWITKTRFFWDQCDEKSRGTSGKNRIRPERFLEIEIPLPPLPEQQRIVARIEALDAKIKEIKKLKGEIGQDGNKLLLGSFYKLISGVNLKPMKKIAPITRRPVNIDDTSRYPEIGIRSFGNGTFHKPNINGIDIGSKKLYQVQVGDLLFSNVFAWEGAIAVVQPEDTGRFGSHRFISCVPKEEVVTANFLRFYFLTVEGIEKIGLASPGGAGRNRTLGLDKLEAIDVPVPSYEKQLWFDKLQSKVQEIRKVQSITTVELDALLPSILDKAFKGEL
ncbi:MAG: restriction endonuclease subunit S [Nitrospira sp.]|nr:restriction endonuclease subunit S [Nitrospira sp.]